MNDVKGDYTKNITNNTANNSDVNNVAVASAVRKGNNTSESVTAGMIHAYHPPRCCVDRKEGTGK